MLGDVVYVQSIVKQNPPSSSSRPLPFLSVARALTPQPQIFLVGYCLEHCLFCFVIQVGPVFLLLLFVEPGLSTEITLYSLFRGQATSGYS